MATKRTDMATWARLIIYQGEEGWLEEQRGRSLPVGVKQIRKNVSITVIDLTTGASLMTVARQIVAAEVVGTADEYLRKNL